MNSVVYGLAILIVASFIFAVVTSIIRRSQKNKPTYPGNFGDTSQPSGYLPNDGSAAPQHSTQHHNSFWGGGGHHSDGGGGGHHSGGGGGGHHSDGGSFGGHH